LRKAVIRHSGGGGGVKRNWLPWLGVGAACAACCAPLIAPMWAAGGLFGLSAGAGFSFFGLDAADAACAALLFTAVAVVALLFIARARAKRVAVGPHCQTDGACAENTERLKP
jgi:hypothetical protein